MDIDLTWIVRWLSHNNEHRNVFLDMVFWIYCDYLCENNGYKNLIRIEPSVVLCKDTDAVENGIEYNHDKLYSIVRKVGNCVSESENKGNILLI